MLKTDIDDKRLYTYCLCYVFNLAGESACGRSARKRTGGTLAMSGTPACRGEAFDPAASSREPMQAAATGQVREVKISNGSGIRDPPFQILEPETMKTESEAWAASASVPAQHTAEMR